MGSERGPAAQEARRAAAPMVSPSCPRQHQPGGFPRRFSLASPSALARCLNMGAYHEVEGKELRKEKKQSNPTGKQTTRDRLPLEFGRSLGVMDAVYLESPGGGL